VRLLADVLMMACAGILAGETVVGTPLARILALLERFPIR